MNRTFFVRNITIITILILCAIACKKKTQTIGTSTYDKNLTLNSDNTDTFELRTYTIAEDTTYSKFPVNVLLGKINHPDLGEYQTGFYTQTRLSGVNPNFGDVANIVVDSFVLSLEYRGAYGYVGQQTVQVYELSDNMYRDSNYTTVQDVATKNENWVLGSGSYTFDPNATTIVDTDTVSTQLRIHLDPARAKKIIEDAHNDAYKNVFANNDEFSSQYLKGFYIKVDDDEHPQIGKGIVGYFDIADADSRISIYYKENGEQKPPFHLVFNSECVRYNRFNYNNSGTKLDALLNDSTLGQYEFYALAGKYRGQIEFPTIKNLPKNIIIYSAQIELPIQHLANSKFTYPTQISLYQQEAPEAEFVATYDPTIKGYRANIQSFVQNNVSGQLKKNSLKLSPRGFVTGAEHVIFNGQQTDKKMKPRLIVSYTKF